MLLLPLRRAASAPLSVSPRGGLFWADQGHCNLSSSDSIIFHLWEPKRGKGDEAFCQIRTPLLTVKQWNPDFSEDTRYRVCKLPLHASSLIFSSTHKSPACPPLVTLKVKGRRVTPVTHSSVQFCSLSWPRLFGPG